MPGVLPNLLRALRHRNYRLFFTGQAISLTGGWMTRAATSWLVYRLTQSAWMLGFVSFIGQIPVFFCTPIAGVLADRWDRHRMILITQALAMVQSLALAVLALSGTITIGHIVVLSLVQGFINGFDVPARQSFVVEMVERPADLGNAIALNSSLFNAARLIGPSIAGLIIAVANEGWCFLVDGISYLAVIAGLLLMTRKPRPRDPSTQPLWRELADGWRYAVGSPPILAILCLAGLVSLMGMSHIVLMPIMARELLSGDAHTFGFLLGATGLGALIGGLYLASRNSVLGLGRVIVAATGTAALALLAFAWSRSVVFSFALMLLIGGGFIVQMAACNTILQTIVDDDKRGRVMSLYAMAVMGMAPFGSLIAGMLANAIGVSWTLMIDGLVCCVAAAGFAQALPRIRQHVRPIYARKGIIREVAVGMQAAAQLTAPAEE